MTNAISKLHKALETWSFKYNCYEAVHPWTPFCSDSALEIGTTVFGEAFKLYTTLYLCSQLMQRKYDLNAFKNTAQSVFRSTTFISANAFFALLFFCSSQYLTGKFYYYAVAYFPGFLASAMAVLIEKPSRRSSLAFYVSNVASETLFRIYVGRGYFRPLNHGQVYLFTLSIASLMMLAKKYGFEDDPLSSTIKLIVGPEEARPRRRRPTVRSNGSTSDFHEDDLVTIGSTKPLEALQNHQMKPTNVSANSVLKSRLASLFAWLQAVCSKPKIPLTSSHPLCPHRDCSCLYYVTKASLRALLIGYGTQLGLKLSTKVHSLRQDPYLIKSLATDPGIMKFGLFISTFAGLFKATNCWLRRTTGTSTPNNTFVAGLVAGPSLLIYPSPTVALYVLWKCLEALFNEAVANGVIKNKDVCIVMLYALATSQLFYSALMDPQYMKKSYMAFLDRISKHKLHLVNRSVLDIFGTQASAGYEDYFPDLHPRFMSQAFLGSVWIWMIEQKFVANQVLSW